MTLELKFELIKPFPDQIMIPPQPSRKLIPHWFKKMGPYTTGGEKDEFGKRMETVKKCIPFRDSVLNSDEMPKTPGDVVTLAENHCKKGSKMHIDDVPNWWVPYIIYNVCDMKYSVHVEIFGTEETPLASIICLYEGKIKYD